MNEKMLTNIVLILFSMYLAGGISYLCFLALQSMDKAEKRSLEKKARKQAKKEAKRLKKLELEAQS